MCNKESEYLKFREKEVKHLELTINSTEIYVDRQLGAQE